MTDEFVRAYKDPWTSDAPRFEGRCCRFSDITFLPKPVQKPHPPIWVGGESRRAIRRAAELEDVWHPVDTNPRFPMRTTEQLAEGMRLLASYAERAARDPAEIGVVLRTHSIRLGGNGAGRGLSEAERAPFAGSAEQVAGDIRKYGDMGVGHLVVNLSFASRSVDELMEHIEAFAAEVWPLVGRR